MRIKPRTRPFLGARLATHAFSSRAGGIGRRRWQSVFARRFQMALIELTNPKIGNLVILATDASGNPETILKVGRISSVHDSPSQNHVDFKHDGGRYYTKTKKFNQQKAMMFVAETEIANQIDAQVHQNETQAQALHEKNQKLRRLLTQI